MVKRKREEVNVKPRTKRAKRILEKREPKLVSLSPHLLMECHLKRHSGFYTRLRPGVFFQSKSACRWKM